MTRPALAMIAAISLSGAAWADDTCKAQAGAKNLHGAAETSFITKCKKDASDKCGADAKARNLHGAAATSFVKKCVGDAAG